MPVDGEIVEGMAMIDQHALTGESAPAEKTKGDKVFAATTMLARQDPGRGDKRGQRDDIGKARADSERHSRLQTPLPIPGRRTGGQSGDTDAGRREPRSRHHRY